MFNILEGQVSCVGESHSVGVLELSFMDVMLTMQIGQPSLLGTTSLFTSIAGAILRGNPKCR